MYKRLAASIECVSAQLRLRGMGCLDICGKIRALAVLLWHPLESPFFFAVVSDNRLRRHC